MRMVPWQFRGGITHSAREVGIEPQRMDILVGPGRTQGVLQRDRGKGHGGLNLGMQMARDAKREGP